MNKTTEISVIIPFYNASDFIDETIQSVLNQTFQNWEIILVNDGSTDNSADISKKYLSERIFLYEQKNMGVSMARNVGLKKAKGKYVVFLDADDILSNSFLEKRYDFLETNPQYGFCCSNIIMFKDHQDNIIWNHKGIFDNISFNVLNYTESYESVPSNYMFRKEVIIKNKLFFNPLLSSTADRFFLLELCYFSKGGFIENAPLWYRYHTKSMSSLLSEALIYDNELFYKLIDMNKLYQKKFKKQYSFHKYYILGTSFIKLNKLKGLHYLFIGSFKHPILFIKRFFIIMLR
ncbi:MAG: glycosyltransferase family 2 protein [Bacteroidales bacterium]|nr:glycosyltransferase family 2 protein [Bacteroidales bacterium]